MKKLMILLAVFVISLFAGCNGSATSTPTDPASPPESVTRGNVAPVTEPSPEPTTTATYLEVPTTSKGPEVLWGDVRIDSSTIPEGLELPYWELDVEENAEMLSFKIISKWCASNAPSSFEILTMNGNPFVLYDSATRSVEVRPYADDPDAVRLTEANPFIGRLGQPTISDGDVLSEIVENPNYWVEASPGVRVAWWCNGSHIVDKLDEHGKHYLVRYGEVIYHE